MLTDSRGDRLWREARLTHYPGFPVEELPFGLDEISLFELATGKKCDFCSTEQRVKVYFAWSVRACSVCSFPFIFIDWMYG